MLLADFTLYSGVLHALTRDFVLAVPDDRWDYTPAPPRQSESAAASRGPGGGFAPFCKQVRHVVCVRGVYNAALAARKVDWTRLHEEYAGPLTRHGLLSALDEKQQQLLERLADVDEGATIDWDGTPFTFSLFTGEFVQHESIHHGQWSLYAALGGFATPESWRTSWRL